jgi:hypothetical protein
MQNEICCKGNQIVNMYVYNEWRRVIHSSAAGRHSQQVTDNWLMDDINRNNWENATLAFLRPVRAIQEECLRILVWRALFIIIPTIFPLLSKTATSGAKNSCSTRIISEIRQNIYSNEFNYTPNKINFVWWI